MHGELGTSVCRMRQRDSDRDRGRRREKQARGIYFVTISILPSLKQLPVIIMCSCIKKETFYTCQVIMGEEKVQYSNISASVVCMSGRKTNYVNKRWKMTM